MRLNLAALAGLSVDGQRLVDTPGGGIPGRESFAAAFQVEEIDDAAGTFSGHASVFGSLVDTWIPTRILAGAFAETLGDEAQRKRVRMLWQHDYYQPIGLFPELREDEKGLFVRGKVSGTTTGKDALVLLRDGVVRELSIGFDPIEWEMVQEKAGENAAPVTVRLVKKAKLWEVSLVTFAADPNALIEEIHRLETRAGAPLGEPEKAQLRALIETLRRAVGDVEPEKPAEPEPQARRWSDEVRDLQVRAMEAAL